MNAHAKVAALALLAAPLVAQRVQFPVQELLRPAEPPARPVTELVVRRAFAGIDPHDPMSWRRLTGERELLMGRDAWEPDLPERHGILSVETLSLALAEFGDLDAGSIRIFDLGAVTLVRSDVPERLGFAMGQIERSLPPRIRFSLRLERVSEQGDELVLEGAQTFRNGETQAIADVRSRPFVRDFDVEIAGAASSASPIMGESRSGASAAVRVRPLPRRDEALVEAIVRVSSDTDTEPIRPHPDMGPLDRVGSRISECGTVFRIMRGATTLHEWMTHDGATLRLTCRAEWDVGPTPQSDVQLVCTSLFAGAVLGFPYATAGGEIAEPGESTSIAFLAAEIGDREPEGLLEFENGAESGGGCLLVEGDRGRAIVERVASAIDEVLAPTRVTVEAFDVRRGATPGEGAEPAADARLLARAVGPAIVGHSSSFGTLTETSHVATWGIEVASSARIPDPEVRIVEDGWFATVRPEASASGRVTGIRLAFDLQSLVELSATEVSLNTPTTAPAAVSDATPPSVWLPQDRVIVERPIVRTIPVAVDLDLDDGGLAEVRRSADGLLGPGRELLVRVRVE